MRQVLIWIDGTNSVALKDEPQNLWTLVNQMPKLPIVPVHGHNAYLEDRGHDWHWNNGRLRYSSAWAHCNVWVLAEFADDCVK